MECECSSLITNLYPWCYPTLTFCSLYFKFRAYLWLSWKDSNYYLDCSILCSHLHNLISYLFYIFQVSKFLIWWRNNFSLIYLWFDFWVCIKTKQICIITWIPGVGEKVHMFAQSAILNGSLTVLMCYILMSFNFSKSLLLLNLYA